MCDESRKVLVLRPNQDVDVTVKECFSLDKKACIIFQKYDEDWGEFNLIKAAERVHVKLEKFSFKYMSFFLETLIFSSLLLQG